MKRIFITAFAIAALIACNSNDKSTTTDTTETKEAEKSTETSITDNPDYQAGLALIAQSDCLTCHKVDEPLTGPTYRDVANKYADQAPGIIPVLAEKIIKGGSGVWGQVPMLPHPTISQADAETMVKYILLLKNK
ncbi:MAG TPA: c-type cytochrome [Chitinophagaceae bacterium]|nr:c-type cytochrome [Chitinophagaceae bacterium]